MCNSPLRNLSRRAAVACRPSSRFLSQLQNKRSLNGSLSLVANSSLRIFASSFLFLRWVQLFTLTAGGPTTVIKHQLAHLQSRINEARQPAAGATGYNHPAAPQQDNGTAMNRYLPIRVSATSDEPCDFQHAVNLLTFQTDCCSRPTPRKISSLILFLLCCCSCFTSGVP